MAAALLEDLPPDMPGFQARFGSDAQCRAYLVRARCRTAFAAPVAVVTRRGAITGD